jgi:hypothetical protein
MNNSKYFWSESIKHLPEGVHSIQVKRVSPLSRISHVDETFSRGRWLKFCGKYNFDSYTLSRFGSRKNVVSKVICAGKQKFGLDSGRSKVFFSSNFSDWF